MVRNQYPDKRGMGYPFDKTWKSRINSSVSVREIVKDLPHVMISDFTIYRFTKLYEGCQHDSNGYSNNVTWENTIRNFFTRSEINCMRPRFNLDNKESVALNAGIIYEVVKDGVMPPGNPWNTTWVHEFRKWMCAGFP